MKLNSKYFDNIRSRQENKGHSKTFQGKSNIEKHRIVYRILDSELKNGVHALTLNLSDIE